MADGHPVFSRFHPVVPYLDSGLQVDSFLGTVFRREFNAIWELGETAPYPPKIDEEYFEWISLLASLEEAGDVFTFVELGAGYGRWSIRAAAAAKQSGRDVRLVCVEGDAQHYEWLLQTLNDNNISPADHDVRRAAAAGEAGRASFTVGRGGRWSPAAWYGQRMAPSRPTWRHRALRLFGVISVVEVDTVTLDSLMEPLANVDLIDCDIQGAEYEVIRASRDLTKVHRMHIETHTPEIERQLREYLTGLGWVCEFAYGFDATRDTPYGSVTFQGGVQAWVNPHHPRANI